MSQEEPSFTAKEIEEFEEAGFRRDKGDRRDWYYHGLYLSRRHKLYIEEKDREAKSEYAEPAYPDSTAAFTHAFSAASPHGEEYSTSDQEGSPPTQVVSLSSVSSGIGGANAPARQNNLALSRPVGSTMTQLGIKRHEIQMYSRKNGWQGLIAILDTDTEENWISKRVVDRLGLVVKSGLAKKWTTFNGQQIFSVATVEPTWCSEGSNKSLVTVFHVVSSAPFDVLMGRSILSFRETDFFSVDMDSNPIQLLTHKKIRAEETLREIQNEVIVQAERTRSAQKPQVVNGGSSKSSKDSPTHNPKNEEEKRHKK